MAYSAKKDFCNPLESHAFRVLRARSKWRSKISRSDEDLMLSFRDGDEDAFEMLYRRYEKPLLNFIYRMVMRLFSG